VEKYVFIALEFTNNDDKSTWGNGKRPSMQDCIVRGKYFYNRFPLMCEVIGVSTMDEIHYKQPRSGVMGNQLEELVSHYILH
jgi:hypothetical protein